MAARRRFDDGDVDVTFHRPGSERVAAGERLTLGFAVEVKNPDLAAAVRDMKTHLRYAGSQHFQPVKEWLKGSLSANMTFSPYDGSNISNLPNMLPVELVDGTGRVLTVCNAALQCHWFTRRMMKEEGALSGVSEPPGRYKNNLLFFGMAGAGKSTMINSVHSMMSDSVVGSIAKSGGAGNHVTTTFAAYPVKPKEHGRPKIARFNIFDTWGLDARENYSSKEFEAMLDGCLKQGHDMAASALTDQTFVHDDSFVAPRDAWSIGCVVFCLSYEDVDEQITPAVERLKQFVGAATSKERNCVVALTKCDVDDTNFPPKDPQEYPGDIKEKLGWLARDLGVPKNRVFPVVSYATTGSDKHFGIDRLLYGLIDQALLENDAFMDRTRINKELEDDDDGDLLN